MQIVSIHTILVPLKQYPIDYNRILLITKTKPGYPSIPSRSSFTTFFQKIQSSLSNIKMLLRAKNCTLLMLNKYPPFPVVLKKERRRTQFFTIMGVDNLLKPCTPGAH